MDATYIVFFATLGLVYAAIILLAKAFRRAPDSSASRRPTPLIAGAIAALAVALFLVLRFFVPGIVDKRVREAIDLTYTTFREKIGKVPDRVTIDPTDCSESDEGWKYRGIAEFHDHETWDVTVTRTTDRARRETKLTCLVQPR